MERHINELIERYNAGLASSSDLDEIEKLIERDVLSISDLRELSAISEKIDRLESPLPSRELDHKVYSMIAHQKHAQENAFSWKKFFSLPELLPRLAFATVALLLGLAGGYYLRPTTPQNGDLASVQKEVTELKEMMMLSLLEKESASERLKAVSLTQEMDQASQKVTSALLQTLNNDSNVNVRLAALDALYPYAKDSHVRQSLVSSIAKQQSPLVQIALAELMVQLQEKTSVDELKKILKNNNTPRDVKKKIEESIHVLI